MSSILIYTDGACRGNQNSGINNLGAWAYLITFEGRTKSNAGVCVNTTNNKMELQAVIEALKALKEGAKFRDIIVYSDSQYVVSGYNDWQWGWRAKNWIGVKNVELWQELLVLASQYSNLTFIRVPGHSDVELNNCVDALCNAAMDQYIVAQRDKA